MTFIYYDNSGKVRMQSEVLNETTLNVIEVNEDIKNTATEEAYYDNGIVYKETPEGKKRNDLIKEIGKAKTVEDLKDIINKLI